MYVSLLEPLGIRTHSREELRLVFPVGDAARAAMTAWRGERGLSERGYLAIIPGTTRPQKMWPDEYWPQLLERVHAEHGLTGLILGGPAERDLAAAIVRATRTPAVSAAGETGIKETGALLESAAATVAVDTGPMHIAVAVGCPTVSLFGSTGPRLFDDGSPYLCLHRQFACWPCHRHPICRHYECLRAIAPAAAARAVDRLLAAGTARADASSNPSAHAAPARAAGLAFARG
ncbi:MAG: glycosyltransferase family 9 protein [Armatimonadetes bacterium]|nr:glycosyltransferase family 9 protein [Armatimonadota bacterium]